MKKLMLLGSLNYLLPVIEEAHKLGVYVITCDYLPDNIAHKHSDKYINKSIINKDDVLAAAQEEKIDGIMSFAVDPGVTTAAYVAEKMELPSCGSYEAVCILQNKHKFRKFLFENGFNVPKSKSYSAASEAMLDADKFSYPIIVKPVDSAGSKGVSKVNNKAELKSAVEYALKYSFSGNVIVEDFIERTGCSSDSDCFSVDGKLVFVSFSAQRFDGSAKNPYTPSAYSWPSTYTPQQENELRNELQRLITLLGLKTSIYNVETRIGTNGKPYIMEVSPRGGGNRLSECLNRATKTNLIKNAVLAAIGEKCEEMYEPKYDGYWAECILHSSKNGIFDGIEIHPDIKKYVVNEDLWIDIGDEVHEFTGANMTIGTILLRFDSSDTMEYGMNNQSELIKIKIK